MRQNKLFRRLFGLVCSSVILVLAGVFTTAVGSSAAPKTSNNGTVDITNSVGHVGNDPKVSCPFSIVFSGFDTDGQVVTATLDAQAPSGSGQAFQQTITLDGSGAGIIPVTGLDTSKLKATSNGVHLELDVVGVPFKNKTFWAKCGATPNEPTTTTTTEAPTTTTIKTTVTVPSVVTTVPAQVLGQTIVSSDGQPAQSGTAAQVAAPASAAAPAAQVAGVTALAHTGPNTKNLLIIATWLFALGGALVTFSKLGRVPSGS